MILLAVGCSYRNTPVEFRERLAFDGDKLARALDELNTRFGSEYTWLDCEALERRHGMLQGWLIVLDLVIPDVPYLERRERLAERIKNEWDEADDGGLAPARARLDAQEALKRLPEKLRLVLVMSLYEGLPYEEIGRILNIPVGTVKSRVFLALSRLKEWMGENSK